MFSYAESLVLAVSILITAVSAKEEKRSLASEGKRRTEIIAPEERISNSIQNPSNLNTQSSKNYERSAYDPLNKTSIRDPLNLDDDANPKDCDEIYRMGYIKTDVYAIYPDGLPDKIFVRCDMQSDSGGWTVIQRRVSQDVSFDRSWNGYKKGFGDLRGSFWLGNDNIHALTVQGLYHLRIDMAISATNTSYARYYIFAVGNEPSGYVLTVSGYSGNAQDSFSYHSGMKFTTWDKDNDRSYSNCAYQSTGGWWFNACYQALLNGRYAFGRHAGLITWNNYTDNGESLLYADMKIRKRD